MGVCPVGRSGFGKYGNKGSKEGRFSRHDSERKSPEDWYGEHHTSFRGKSGGFMPAAQRAQGLFVKFFTSG
jgi:hypothetical protein